MRPSNRNLSRTAAPSPSIHPSIALSRAAALRRPKHRRYIASLSLAAQDHLMIFLSTALWVHVQEEKKTAYRTVFTTDQNLFHSVSTLITRSRTLDGSSSFLPAALSTALDGRWSVPVPPAGARTILLPARPTQRSEKSQPCCLPSGRKEAIQQRYSITF